MKHIYFRKVILQPLFLICTKCHFADLWNRTQEISVGPFPISKSLGFTCFFSCSKHVFLKLFQDVSKVQFHFTVTIKPNYLMLISYNLLHWQLSSWLIFTSQLNVHFLLTFLLNWTVINLSAFLSIFPLCSRIQSKLMHFMNWGPTVQTGSEG